MKHFFVVALSTILATGVAGAPWTYMGIQGPVINPTGSISSSAPTTTEGSVGTDSIPPTVIPPTATAGPIIGTDPILNMIPRPIHRSTSTPTEKLSEFFQTLYTR
ncbi:hypothetical protein DFH06DRAFT_1216519 [Mycena polygramma]|nr:hypothetical protein DFH06DRAFT_1216519 [Mycena polygramma]